MEHNSKKTVAIFGSSGFVGSHLCAFLKNKNYKVLAYGRKEFSKSTQELADILSGTDYIINLSGANISKRWTKKYKLLIRDSRILTTRKLVDAIELMEIKPQKFVNVSAIGIYDFQHKHTEDSTAYGNTFLSHVVKDWEKEALRVKKFGVNLVIPRLGVVLDIKGGALPKMCLPFRFKVGGKIGSGNQKISFIHMEDVVEGFHFILRNPALHGVFNFVAPKNTTNATLAKHIASFLNTRSWFHIPSWFFKLMFGEMAILLTHGENVVPKRLTDAGFEFAFPDATNAIYNSFQ